jgi:beta-lactamase class A
VAAIALSMATTAFAQNAPTLDGELRGQFERRLESIAASADGVIGYVVVDVNTGDRFARLGATPFPTASTIKLVILYELLKQAEEGKVQLDAVTPMDRSRAVPGGLLYELTSPALSARDLAIAMILQSDNTATNVLIDRLGMAAVNQRMAGLGLSNTRLRRHMIDLEAARRGDENISTPDDLARLVLVFHNGEGLDARSKRAALDILQKFKRTPIRSGVPASVVVASKSGELEGVRADAGVVYLPGRPYVFVAMGTYLRDAAQPSAALESLASASYDYFSRRATASAFGRQIK